MALAALPWAIPTAAQPAACDYSRAPYTIQKLPFAGLEAFSPDGSKIAYSEGTNAIKILDIGLGAVVATLDVPGTPVTIVPYWASTGKIFFVTKHEASNELERGIQDGNPSTPFPLWVINEDGTGLQRLDYPEGIPMSGLFRYWGYPHVSPDGSLVLVFRIEPGSWTIYAMDVQDGPNGIRLVNARTFASSFAFIEPKDFTRDGKQVVIASTKGSGPGDKGLNSDVFTYDLEGNEIQRYTWPATWEEDADVLDGDGGAGDAVVFISDRDTPNPEQHTYSIPTVNNADWAAVALGTVPLNTWTSHELFVAGPQGDRGWVRRLTFDYDNSGWVVRQPQWSPDGERVVFLQQADRGRAGWNYYDSTAWRVMLLTFDCASTTSGPPLVPLPTHCSADDGRAFPVFQTLYDGAKDVQYILRGQTGQALPVDLAAEIASAGDCTSSR